MLPQSALETVIRYIDGHPCAKTDDLASAAHYAKSYVCQGFYKVTGLSLRDLLRARKLTRGAELLIRTDRAIPDIALECGYSSMQSFSDAFSRAYRCSPARFRRQGRFYPLYPPMPTAPMTKTLAAIRKGSRSMADQKSVTALMSAFGRAYHLEHEAHPVFRDSLARELFSDGEYAFMRGCLLEGRDFFGPDAHESDEELMRELVNVFIAPTPLCRSAYCENALLTAERTGTEQYVMLGAGLDSFAFRNTRFASRHMIYEADHPASQADKLMRVKRAGWTVPDNLRFVPVDFAADDLAEKLSEAGFNPSRKTFFSWLGVSYYLTRDQIEEMLWGLSALCRGGGTVLFDYADQGLFSAQEKRVQNMIALAAAGAEPMRSCFSEPELERLLEEQGFLIYEALSPKDIQTQIIDPSGCAMTAFEHIHYVQAVKKPGTD